ncbi:MAG: hypothetical protein A3H44_04450 [Gammaproteobacteria bacterium RIFCSPLOWO2_02_FULL_57_10]|nr:MAG: hypothetical protein A3H44_04450 [Gammaproteobacteria bacterium RIFCSPLOWO2_02_FULL_57_10]
MAILQFKFLQSDRWPQIPVALQQYTAVVEQHNMFVACEFVMTEKITFLAVHGACVALFLQAS